MTIKLSLICPVYKVGQYLPELMQSLLSGVNNEQVEIIFVDDCCPENSIAICEQFIIDHQDNILFRTKVLKLETNKGQAAARNRALLVASGMYIGFIDSDDAIDSSYWDTLAPYIEKSNSDIIEFTFEEFINELPENEHTNSTVINELPSSNLNPFHTGFFVWTRLYNAATVKGLLFPEGKVYEDIFYNIHAFAKSKSSIRLDACLVYYRKREGSTTSLRTSQYSHLLINLITAVEQVIENSPNQKEIVSLLQQRTLILMLKGLKIKNKQERLRYFSLCSTKLQEVTKLVQIYGSTIKSKLFYALAKLICAIFMKI